MTTESGDKHLLVQIASYNTNLQGDLGLPQDLVDWLSPTLTVSKFLSGGKQTPDLVAVGFQELLPLHLGLAGFSKTVINSRDSLIRSQIEAHSPDKERYVLVAKVVNVGVALLVYARDGAVASRVCDVQTQWTGCGPAWMGNKGAVGVRFRMRHETAKPDDLSGELFTFVNAHLTAHAPKLASRVADFHHIVSTLLFRPSRAIPETTTMYNTSHLFFLGDLNFRLSLPAGHQFSTAPDRANQALLEALNHDDERERLREFDQLTVERRKGTAFVGLREGDFWKFKCTYKYNLGEVDKYSLKRFPSWTDRILYTTYTDSPDKLEESNIKSLLYTSVPSYTTSDHKPVVSLLLVPTKVLSPSPAQSRRSIPILSVPPFFKPTWDPQWVFKRHVGKTCDWTVGLIWSLFWIIGFGNVFVGIGNFIFGLVAWLWVRDRFRLPTLV